ncbi:MAG: hypothetical protein GX217_02120 [Clostridiaceae bacterium]|nr:hypothetical protein [Clostridiaceae bacterium]
MEGNENSLLYKHPSYIHQQEFRIIVHENLNYITENRIIDDIEMECIVGYENKTYLLKNNLVKIAKIVKLSDCENLDGNIFINSDLKSK